MREPANTSRQQDNDRESFWRALHSNSLNLLNLLNHLAVESLTTESTLRFSKIHILTTPETGGAAKASLEGLARNPGGRRAPVGNAFPCGKPAS
jgi:hypothetical protein